MQFRGPVPADLYHRYVEFKPFVAGMFTAHSLRGRLLNRALHHQHARIYNYDRTTKYGVFQEPCPDMTKQFLEFVRYDEGGRIFTYVLTLDGLFRFTETGKEFGIDLLSKHTMHSDVSIYIACSGEFFIRRVKNARAHKNDDSVDPDEGTHPPAPEPKNSPEEDTIDSSSNSHSNDNRQSAEPETNRDPSRYELIIDNDSGTYRPNAEKLPMLRDFLSRNLPGLKVATLDCQGDKEKMDKLKNEQRERKKKTGKQVMYMQNSSASSISSSDEEYLEARAAGGQPKESKYKHEMHKVMDGGKDHHHDGGEKATAADEQNTLAETDGNAHHAAQANGAVEGQENEKRL